MCGFLKPKTPDFSAQKAETITPDNKTPSTTPATARSSDAERRLRAGYKQTIFTSGTGAALGATQKKTAMGA